MIQLQEFNLPSQKHRERQRLHLEAAKSLKESIENFDFSKLDSIEALVDLPDEIPMASNPKWANRQFGAVNTVEKSACVAFVSKVILDYFNIHISMLDLLSLIEDKGYRMWKLAKTKKTLNCPKADYNVLKKILADDVRIKECNNLNDIFKAFGDPEGIGGSMFLIDSIIESISSETIKVFDDTRIKNINQLITNLKNGIPVPIRVQNSIYHDDPTRAEGHYVILFGITSGTAIIVDSSWDEGIRFMPAQQLISSVTDGNESLICAWNLSCIKK